MSYQMTSAEKRALSAKITGRRDREQAEAAREAASLYDAETGDRAQRALEGARYDAWRDAGRGDDYEDRLLGDD